MCNRARSACQVNLYEPLRTFTNLYEPLRIFMNLYEPLRTFTNHQEHTHSKEFILF